MKRRPMLVVGGTLASAILLWLTLREPRPANDDARYQVWLEGPTTYNRIVDFQKHLSPRTSRLLGLYYLKQRSLAGHESLGRSLHESGYLTNLAIPMTNAEARSVEIGQKLLQASLMTGVLWSYTLREQQIVLTCRTKDVTNFLQAFEKAWATPWPPP